MKILILCTGNSYHSQMAEGFLISFDRNLEAYSAGTYPAVEVHPKAVTVMGEVGIDLSSHLPKPVDDFLNDAFDFVITVCDNANKNCPVFNGDVKHRLHIGFKDPAEATGSKEEIMEVFRSIRDEIRESMHTFYIERLKN